MTTIKKIFKAGDKVRIAAKDGHSFKGIVQGSFLSKETGEIGYYSVKYISHVFTAGGYRRKEIHDKKAVILKKEYISER